jgi:hypothetical protein
MEITMLPSEMIILMAIIINKNTGKRLLQRPMDVTSEYIGYLYESLMVRGYLKEARPQTYQLTPSGKKAIFDFIKLNKTRAKDVVQRLQMLGIEISLKEVEKISGIEKETLKAEQI